PRWNVCPSSIVVVVFRLPVLHSGQRSPWVTRWRLRYSSSSPSDVDGRLMIMLVGICLEVYSPKVLDDDVCPSDAAGGVPPEGANVTSAWFEKVLSLLTPSPSSSLQSYSLMIWLYTGIFPSASAE